jgi:hypothetical protein
MDEILENELRDAVEEQVDAAKKRFRNDEAVRRDAETFARERAEAIFGEGTPEAERAYAIMKAEIERCLLRER